MGRNKKTPFGSALEYCNPSNEFLYTVLVFMSWSSFVNRFLHARKHHCPTPITFLLRQCLFLTRLWFSSSCFDLRRALIKRMFRLQCCFVTATLYCGCVMPLQQSVKQTADTIAFCNVSIRCRIQTFDHKFKIMTDDNFAEVEEYQCTVLFLDGKTKEYTMTVCRYYVFDISCVLRPSVIYRFLIFNFYRICS